MTRCALFLAFSTFLLLGLSGRAEAEDSNFTGTWNIIPLVVGTQQASASFDVQFTQSGSTVTGTIDPNVQITGAVAGNDLTATITRGDTRTVLTLTLDPSGSVVTGTIAFNGKPTVAWIGTRGP